MKRSKAWQRVADSLSKSEAKGEDMRNGGLCVLIARMFPKNVGLSESMRQDIKDQEKDGGFERDVVMCDEDYEDCTYTSVYMFDPYDPSPRIVMAQLFALAAQDEGD